MQSRKHSAAESIVNIVAGFALNYAVNYWVLRACGYSVSGESVLTVSTIMTVLSFGRSYLIRRGFNKLSHGALPVGNAGGTK